MIGLSRAIGGLLDDSKKFLMILIPGCFFVFMVLISALTGANPIESFFLLVGQVLLYLGGLIVFGTPIAMLVAFITMTLNEDNRDDIYEEAAEADENQKY